MHSREAFSAVGMWHSGPTPLDCFQSRSVCVPGPIRQHWNVGMCISPSLAGLMRFPCW